MHGWRQGVALSASLVLWTGTGAAQSGGDGGSGSSITTGMIAEALISALKELLRSLFSPIESIIETHANSLLRLIVGTPHPETVFDAPHVLPWTTLYQYYWATIVPLTLLLFGLSVSLIILLETTSHLFSGYHRRNLKRRGFAGLLGILSWWWVAALSLQVTDELVVVLLPDLSSVSLFQTLSFSGMGLLGLLATLSVDFVLFGLLAVLYLGRRLVLFGFTLGMPLLIVAWIPGVGPFSFVSRFAKRLAGFFVPFLLMPVPVALLLRLAGLLGDAATLSMGGIGTWLTALVLPFVAVVTPFVLIWQAGALLFVTERLSRRASRGRMRARLERGQSIGTRMERDGRRALSNLRDTSPRGGTEGSQARSEAVRSRAATLGQRLSRAPHHVREQFTDHRTQTSSYRESIQIEPDEYEPREFDTRTRRETTEDRTDE
ncbi:MAG: hypothetical protein ABEI98_04875 [Halorhabdus sp.]